jgi:hypothetical protein
VNLLILLVVTVLFGLAAFNVPAPRRVSWGWLGLFVVAVWQLLATIPLSIH